MLELISSYSFNLYYIKGKDMVLSAFWQDKSTMIAILMKKYLFPLICTKCFMKKYYDIGNIGNYLVQIRSETKSSGITLPEVHGQRKNLDPNVLPEK